MEKKFYEVTVGENYANDFRLWYKTTIKQEVDTGEELYYTYQEYINTIQFPSDIREEIEEEIQELNNEEVTVTFLYLTDINSLIIKEYNV